MPHASWFGQRSCAPVPATRARAGRAREARSSAAPVLAGATPRSPGAGAGGRQARPGAGGSGGKGGADAGGSIDASDGGLAGNVWTGTWASSPQSCGGAFGQRTLREIVHTSIAGNAARVRISNTFSGGPLQIRNVHLA